MNIFEDFIDELKEDNLLEETSRNTKSEETSPTVSEDVVTDNNAILVSELEEDELTHTDDVQISTVFDSTSDKEHETIFQAVPGDAVANKIEFETNQVVPNDKDSKEAEFFRKRAINEVSFLQVVEHVFAGVERDQMKVVPKPYDALQVKKILHTFLQVSKEKNTSEQAQAEFQLLQETENWYSTLTHRDKRISINHLRRYCETARPPLSSPALVSLARFYRNSPYSEQVRGKFDFVVTRLFSKDTGDDRREMAFDRDDLIIHLTELYAEWSSIPLYSTDEDDSEILLIALKFEDFITEAAVAESFDELIKNDFFNRLRLFKKETDENFFSPLVVAADVESNIKIGNRYVELLEKEKPNKSIYEDKYGFLHDQSISDATGKTFQLVELLNRKTEKPKPTETKTVSKNRTKPAAKPVVDTKKETKATNEAKPFKEKSKVEANSIQKQQKTNNKNYFGVSNRLLAIIFTVIAFIGLYVWSNGSGSEAKKAASEKTVNLENSSLKEIIETARIKNEIFTATVLPAWSGLTAARKEELLKKIMSLGATKGFKQVQLLNKEGKTVGFASPEKAEIYTP